MPSVSDAKALAHRAHAGQLDKAGHQYIRHPATVAAALAEHGDHAVMAGWLHDVVEDTDVTLDDLRAAGYPEEVVTAVDSVTRRPGEIYLDMVRRAAAHPLGRLVKLADNAHNSSPERLAVLAPDVAAGLARRYAKARLILLAAGAEEVDTGHHAWGNEQACTIAGCEICP